VSLSTPSNSSYVENRTHSFERVAETYDNAAVMQSSAASQLLAFLPKKTASIKRILEIGCGTGLFTEQLVKTYPDAEILALDVSSRMLQIAKNKLKDYSQIQWLQIDAENAFLADTLGRHCSDSWNLIVSNATMQWFHNFGVSVSKYADLLSEDGSLVFSMFGPKTFQELQSIFQEQFADQFTLPASRFLPAAVMLELVRESYSDVTFEFGKQRFVFDTLIELLRFIKLTGTHSRLSDQGLMSPKTLMKMDERYRERFNAIIATSEIFLVSAQN